MFDRRIAAHLKELVMCCTGAGEIVYANPAAERWSRGPLAGRGFGTLLLPGSVAKGEAFLDAARAASHERPTDEWELLLGDTDAFRPCAFWGYLDAGELIVLGQIESDLTHELSNELLRVSSELGELQRRKDRTIIELGNPVIPVWDRVLLLPLIGHIDGVRARSMTERLLRKVTDTAAEYVVIDASGVAFLDTLLADHLARTSRELRLLGAQAVLVGVSAGLARAMADREHQVGDFLIYRDLHSAIAHVIQRLKGVSS